MSFVNFWSFLVMSGLRHKLTFKNCGILYLMKLCYVFHECYSVIFV